MTSPRPGLLSLEGLPRNARNSILLEPLWAVFGVVVMYYAPLYMAGVGLSSTEIGVIGSVALLTSFVFQLIAAPITNRFGRKRTTLIGDLLSWTLPMFVWAFANSFAAFLIAALLAAVGSIVSVSWSLLVIEDVEGESRARVFGILGVIVAICGMLTPIIGALIAQWGVVPTLRVYYVLGGIGMTVMFLWRNAITSETQNGAAAMLEHKDLHPISSLQRNLTALIALRRTPGLPWVVAFYVATLFLEQMSLFQILFLEQTLGFKADILSFVPFIVAIVSIVMYGFAGRLLSNLSAERALVYARVAGLVGSVMLLLIPRESLLPLLVTVAVLASASYLTQTLRSTVLFNRLPQSGAAEAYSGVQALTMLFGVPAAAIAGALFALEPRWLFGLIAVLNVGLLGLAWQLTRDQPVL